jgi:tetratricopeptide (TPR) repeat protein
VRGVVAIAGLFAVLGLAACPQRRAPEGVQRVMVAAPARARAWYLRAAVAENRGELEEAERSLGWVLRLDGDSPWSHLAWGRYLDRQRRTEEALVALARAVELGPGLGAVHLAYGDVLVRAGRDDEAEHALRRAVARGAGSEALHILGRLYLRIDDRAGAERVLDEWLALPSVGRHHRLARGRLALRLSRASVAVDDLEGVLGEPGISAGTGELMLEAATRSCRLGTAWHWANTEGPSVRARPDWSQVVLLIGRATRDPGLVADGLAALDRRPDVAEERIVALLQADRVDEALVEVRDARRRWLADPLFKRLEGEVLAAMGRVGPALMALERLPDDPLAVSARVDILLATDVETAQAVATSAWDRARVLVARDSLSEAEALAEDATELAALRLLAGDEAGALEALVERPLDHARLLADLGREDEALAAVQERDDPAALELRARLGDVRAARVLILQDPCSATARVAIASGRGLSDALRLLEAAVDAAPWHVGALDALGRRYLEAGRPGDAIAMWKRAAARDVDEDRLLRLENVLRREGRLAEADLVAERRKTP